MAIIRLDRYREKGRAFAQVAVLCASCCALIACETAQPTAIRPEPLTPAPVPPVSASPLPPLGAAPAASQVPGAPGTPGVSGGPGETAPQDLQALPTAGAASTGVVPSQDVSVGPDIDFGREAVLGAWNVASEGDTCAMNLSLTTWTGGFRASTRNCTNETLVAIGAWQLSGKQLTLLDATGNTISRLFASGPNRFDGTTESGGKAISAFR